MSNRRSSSSGKRVRRSSSPASIRGGSRPIDPRRAPGYAPRRGIDPFAMGLIVVSALAILVVLLFLVLQGNNSGTQASNNTSSGSNVTPDWTQTTVAFSTQTAPDVLPRISLQEAKALYDAGDIRIIDVRDKKLYDAGHIKGAVNVPHTDVGSRIKDLPRTGNLVLYCQ